MARIRLALGQGELYTPYAALKSSSGTTNEHEVFVDSVLQQALGAKLLDSSNASVAVAPNQSDTVLARDRNDPSTGERVVDAMLSDKAFLDSLLPTNDSIVL